MHTKKDCLELLKVLESKKKGLRKYLEILDEEKFRIIPAEGKWSAIMIAHHLFLTEYGSLAYCKKKLSFDTVIPMANEEVAKMESKTAYLMRSKEYKMEAPVFLNTEALDNKIKLDTLFDMWSSLRLEMKKFLQSCVDDVFNRTVYKHPVGGRLRLIGMLMFFDAHLDGHQEQIKRNFELIASN